MIGKTEVLLNTGQMAELDVRRTEVLGCEATRIQRTWKTYCTWKNYLHLREVSVAIEASCRAKLARNLYEHMRQQDASTKIQKYWHSYTIRKSYKNLVAMITIIQVGLRAMAARMEFVVRMRNRAATRIRVWQLPTSGFHVASPLEPKILREISKEKASLEEERRKKLKEEDGERAQLEAKRLAAKADEERQREIKEAVRLENLAEEERQRASEEADRQRKLEEDERQKAAEEAEKQKILEEEERLRAIEETEGQKALGEEEKCSAIEEERQKALAEEEMRRAIEGADRQKALEAERQNALAEAMKKQGAEIDQLKIVESKVWLEEERERERLEAERLAATAEQTREKDIEKTSRWKNLKKEVRQRAAEEAERRKKIERAERRKKLKEEEQQRATQKAEMKKALDAARQRQLGEEHGRREIEDAGWQKAVAEEEKRRTIEEPEKQKVLAGDKMQRAIEEAERQTKALEAERQKSLAEAMENQGAEIDQFKSNLEASQENELLKKKSAQLQDKVGEANKEIVNGFQETIRRLEVAYSTEALLQTERQEHDVTKNELAQRSEELKKAEENSCRIKQLLKKMRRIKEDELAVLKEEHEITINELEAAQKRNNEFGEKTEYLDRKVAQLQDDLQRYKGIATEKDVLLQTEKQEHDATKNILAKEKQECEAAKYALLKEKQEHDATQSSLAKEKQEHDATKNDLAKIKQEHDETEHALMKERREHDDLESAFRKSQAKVKELQNEFENADKRIYDLESDLKRLGEEVLAKEESVQIEKRKHEATQRVLAQAKEYSEKLLKRNESYSSRIDKLHEYIARLEEKAKEVQEKLLKGNQEIWDSRKHVADVELRNKELLQKVQLADKKIIQLQDALERIEENAKQGEVMLQTEKQQHDETKSSLSSAYGKIQQLERFEQEVMAKILSERQQHDATKRALSDSERKKEELQQKLQFWDSTIEQLCETNKRPGEKAFALEQENNTPLKHPSNLGRMNSTPRGDFYSEDDRDQNAISEHQQQENKELLMRSISQYLGFVNGSPVAANLIYKCLVNWKSFEADRTGVFDSLIQKISFVTEGYGDNETIAYWLSNLSTLVSLLQNIHRTSGGPVGPAATHRQRMSRTYSSTSGFDSNFGGAAENGAKFIQQLIMLLENLLATIKRHLKNELTSLLNSSLQAPKISRLSSTKGLGKALGSPSGQWHIIVRILDNYLNLLESNYVPTFIIQRLFIQIFQIMNAQLFNSNGEFLKAGLGELESWCCRSTDEYVVAAWRELRHIRQAVDFLVAPQKQRSTLMEICNDICPSLTMQQIHRLSTLYWDDKYGTNDISQQVNAEINQMMAREPNRAFMLTEGEGSSPPLTLDELSISITTNEMRDSDMPISIRNQTGFAFLQQRRY